MRLIYADPGLYSNLGHHANSCRALRDAFAERQVAVETLGHRMIEPELRDELRAHPHFRCFTYWYSDGDPISGWLNAFQTTVRATEEDLLGIGGLRAEDVLYLNSARPGQFLALVNWAKRRGDDRPAVVVEFGDDPGIGLNPDGGFTEPRDHKAALWRHAASQMPEGGLPRFRMATFDPQVSALYSALLKQRVDILPLPQGRRANPVDRTGRRPVTIGVLGHQRGDKGYHLMPAVAAILLHALPQARLLLHNAAPEQLPETQAQLRAMAAADPRLALDERVAGPAVWQELLDRTDLMLCPYDPGRYAIAYSAVAAEALANGIPLVVPDGTTLSKTVAEHGGAGMGFAQYEPRAIAIATAQALDEYDRLAGLAFRASGAWGQAHGAGNTASEILKLAEKN